jgi:hypothetical protein
LNASFVTASPFDYGSGHINPNLAVDPGLVYDATTEDYLNFYCSIGYKIRNYTCPTSSKTVDLNYPSISIPMQSSSLIVRRRVKNVGSSIATYTVRVKPPLGVSVSIPEGPNVQ